MSQLPRISRKLRWAVPAGAVVVVGGVLAGTMLASAAPPSLPHRTPAQLIAGMRTAKLPAAMTAVLSETANLGIPALPDIAGMPSSALSSLSMLSGTHTVQVWYAGPRHVRIALPVPFGETDLRVNGSQVWLWDSHDQTATHLILPARLPVSGAPFRPVPGGKTANGSRPLPGMKPGSKKAPSGMKPGSKKAPSGMKPGAGQRPPFAALTPIQAADRLLALIGPTTKVTVAGTTTVANRAAYELAIAPRSSQSLIGKIVIDVAASGYLPLQVQVFARGSASPAVQFGFTSLSTAKPAMSNFTFTPPAGAHVKTIRLPSVLPGAMSGFVAVPGKPGAPRPAVRAIGLPAGVQVPAGPVRILGTGWTAVAVIQPGSVQVPAGLHAVPVPVGRPGPNHRGPRIPVMVRPAPFKRAVHRKGVASQVWAPIGVGSTNSAASAYSAGSPGPGSPLFGLLKKITTPVHGAWGSGRLLRTSLISVLFTSKGQILVGAVTPATLFADAAKVK